MTAFQPLYGHLADVFGRRYPLIFAVIIFMLGSGLCGGTQNIAMLIAGRAVQGLGGSGITVLVELIICDLVPLRERGNFMAIIFGVVTLGTALGPVFSGLIVEYSSWRWVFYLNLPVAGSALILLIPFLQVNYHRTLTIVQSLKRIDFIGNFIFISACISALIALGWAGTVYPWSSFRVIVPLVLGFLGFGIFVGYEESGYPIEPTIPLRLFSNRTSLVAFILTFIHGLAVIYMLYFLPVYFQGVLMSTPSRSGVQLLPTVLVMIAFGAAGGGLLARFGQYIPLHLIGYAIMILGFGLFTLLNETSSIAEWVIYQAIEAAGAGVVIAALLPAVQAQLSEADTAKSTATWGFVRVFGIVWGNAISATVFNNRFDQLAYQVSDPTVRAMLSNDNAYEHATKSFVAALPSENGVRAQVIRVFVYSLKRTWQVGIAFVGLGFLLVFLEQRIELRKDLETKYGMKEEAAKDGQTKAQEDNAQKKV